MSESVEEKKMIVPESSSKQRGERGGIRSENKRDAEKRTVYKKRRTILPESEMSSSPKKR